MERIVTNYEDMESDIDLFRLGKLGLLILAGPGGLGKSHTARTVLGHQAHYLKGGTLTAFEFYRQLWEYNGLPIVIDDIDAVVRDRAVMRLVRCVCETETVKPVAWLSSTNILKSESIPKEFACESRVLIITNEWRSLDRHIKAVGDRGIVDHFQPSPLTVHERVGSGRWADPDVYDFIGGNLALVQEPSMRHYEIAGKYKAGGKDWKRLLFQQWGVSDDLLLVTKLLADPSFTTEQERVEAFERSATGARSRATYYRLVQRLRPGQQTPANPSPVSAEGQP